MIIVFTFFIGLLPAKAEVITYLYGSAAGNLSINKDVNTSSGIGVLPLGAKVRIYDQKIYNSESGSQCPKMYKITYLDTTGYICTSTTKIFSINTNATNYKDFPTSYWPFLDSIKKIYPNVTFQPVNTGIEWNSIVHEQANNLGKNLIQITQTNRDGWKHPDSYLAEKKKFRNDFNGGGSNWYSPSVDIVSYYLDPRNFLNEVHIFMFEKLSYDENQHNIDGVKSIIKGSFMEDAVIKVNDIEDITYAEAFIKAAVASNVSPYHLAARVMQELGKNGDTLPVISGNVAGYENLYNYYNISANGKNVVNNALSYAKGGSSNSTTYDRPWNTPYKAIIGGAKFISESYIGAEQDTNYTQKFDIVGDLYSHQYMQNIQAPASEASQSFSKGITKMNNYKTLPYVFKIPVYLNMPNETALPNPKVNTASLPKLPPTPKIKYGDLNDDGKITVLDLLIVQKYLLNALNLNSNQMKAADVSKDGVVTVLDLLMIQQHILGVKLIK